MIYNKRLTQYWITIWRLLDIFQITNQCNQSTTKQPYHSTILHNRKTHKRESFMCIISFSHPTVCPPVYAYAASSPICHRRIEFCESLVDSPFQPSFRRRYDALIASPYSTATLTFIQSWCLTAAWPSSSQHTTLTCSSGTTDTFSSSVRNSTMSMQNRSRGVKVTPSPLRTHVVVIIHDVRYAYVRERRFDSISFADNVWRMTFTTLLYRNDGLLPLPADLS